MAKEKRSYVRIKFAEGARYWLTQYPIAEGSLAQDLSERGIRVNLDRFIPVRSDLDIQFILPTSSLPIKTKGRVAWIKNIPLSDRFEAGIELLTDPIAAASIRKYINSKRLTEN